MLSISTFYRKMDRIPRRSASFHVKRSHSVARVALIDKLDKSIILGNIGVGYRSSTTARGTASMADFAAVHDNIVR